MTERERQAFISGLSFEGEIEDCDGVLLFTVKKDFDLAAVFEDVYDPAADPPIRRIGLAYCIADEMVWYSMELDFGRPDGMRDMLRTFQLSDREREVLKDKMSGYCLQQTGASLLEYSILHWSDDNGPRPTLTGPAASTQPGQPMSPSISDVDFMELFARQCVEQMARDIQSRVTPEQWEKMAAEAQQSREQQDEQTMDMGPTMG